MGRWSKEWLSSSASLKAFVLLLHPADFELSQMAWGQLNRLRTGCGRNKAYLHKIGATNYGLLRLR